MSEVLTNVINEMIKNANKKEDTGDIRVPIAFSRFDNKRIEYVRKQLKLSKQEMLSRLVMASIQDIEFKLGLLEPSERKGEFLMTDSYRKALGHKNSTKDQNGGDDDDLFN